MDVSQPNAGLMENSGDNPHAITRNQRSPFEGEYGRIVSRKLGEFMGKRIEVVVREVE